MKKRITAALLNAILCLSLISIPAFAADPLHASYTKGATTVSVSGSGLGAGEDFPLITIRKGSELIALDIAGTANADGSLTVASIPTGALSNGDYTVTLYHADGEVAATGSFTVSTTPVNPDNPPDTPDNPGGGDNPSNPGGSGGGGGGGGGSSSANSPKIEKNTGGTVKVSSDGKTVTITPKDGYRIKDVIINGESVGAVTKYVFDKASSKNTVEVIFEKIPDSETPDSTAPSFNDVTGHWAASAINFVVNEGLFNGTSSTTFSPNAPMTRSMLATVLYRLAGEPAASGGSSFADVQSGQWYSNAVAWAAQNGIVTGTGTGFSPNGNITREQLATMLYRFCAYAKGDTSVSKPLNFPDAGNISNWASEAMRWAVGAGIISGTDTGALNPGGFATRAEVATMLMRFINFLG